MILRYLELVMEGFHWISWRHLELPIESLSKFLGDAAKNSQKYLFVFLFFLFYLHFYAKSVVLATRFEELEIELREQLPAAKRVVVNFQKTVPRRLMAKFEVCKKKKNKIIYRKIQ